MSTNLLTVDGLSVTARTAQGDVSILRDVGLELEAGDRVGLIGESGSGKTTLVRTLIGLLDANVQVDAGEARLDGTPILGPGMEFRQEVRGRDIGIVFQSALGSLNPMRRLRSQLRELLKVHRPELGKAEANQTMRELLDQMGVRDADRVLDSYPHQVSGGQRQRVAIAVALAPQPQLVIADECTSALDVSAQAQVVELLRSVAGQDRGLLFVTHDLHLAGELCNKVVVLYRGEVVETGRTEDVLRSPKHPYTERLLAAIPDWEPQTGSWPPAIVNEIPAVGGATPAAEVAADDADAPRAEARA